MWILACTLCKLKMSNFSLSSMLMISSWCAIVRTSFCKSRKNFFKSSKSWGFSFLPWHGSGKGSCTTFVLYQPNWVFQGNYQTLSHGGLKSHRNASLSQDKVEEKWKQGCWDGEGSLSTSCVIRDLCHVVYLVGFGIPNKRGESTHGQSKPRKLDCGQTNFSILARHFVI